MHHINRCCFRTRRSCRRKRPIIRRRYLGKSVLQQIQQGFSAILIIHTTINTFKTSKTKTAKTPKIIKTKRINQTRMPTAYFFTSPNNKTATKNSTNRTYYYYFIYLYTCLHIYYFESVNYFCNLYSCYLLVFS